MTDTNEFSLLTQYAEQKNLSAQTIKVYKSNYLKLYTALGEKPIRLTSQKKVIDILQDFGENPHTRSAVINIAIIIRNIYEYPIYELIDEREAIKAEIIEHTRIKNSNLDLPTYQTIVDHMNKYYASKRWTEYVINYLLIHYQVRNQDVNFELVSALKKTKDKTQNYMVYNKNKKEIKYIRNIYKTNATYGQKVNIISDPRLLNAVRKIILLQNNETEGGVFIPNLNSISYHIQMATYNSLGEGNYIKIILNHFKGDLQKIQEISDNRGTSLDTLVSFYDIQNI